MGFSRQEYWSGVPLPSPVRTAAPGKEELDGEVGTHEAGAGLVGEAEGAHDGFTPGRPLPDGHRVDPGGVSVL